jgi:alpha-ketoglutarate-dependent taurine dioxygenase
MSDQKTTTRDIAEGFDTDDDADQAQDDATTSASLLPDAETERFTVRWQEIQASFVDEPRTSVEQADALVADLMQRLAAGFSDERQRLEAQWDRGDDVSTENLRVALTRYRSFFDRLLAA